MIYTSQQQEAIDRGVEALLSGKPLYRIGGYAGTGKTTVLKEIVNKVEGLAPCAFMGKAASVLRKKGIKATTIHARIYSWSEKDKSFQLFDKVPYSGFALDEASMVGDVIFNDLQSFNIPILAVGDPGQLGPISSKEINLMGEPDIILTEIHRQAKGNPIIDLATRIRTGQDWGLQDDDERCIVARKAEAWDSIEWADIVVCGYNRTRVEINKRKRNLLGNVSEIEEGERIMCLQNDKTLGLFNGLMFEVLRIKSIDGGIWRCDVKGDDGTIRTGMPIWTGHFNRVKPASWQTLKKFSARAMVADYGYGATCHKIQGSEHQKVVVMNQEAPKLWNQVRWLYTAITRASDYLRLFK